MSRLAADQETLLRALAGHAVELVVVGGVAAQVHGRAGRTWGSGTVFSTAYGRLEIRRDASIRLHRSVDF